MTIRNQSDTPFTYFNLIWWRGEQEYIELLLQRLQGIDLGQGLELADFDLTWRSLMLLSTTIKTETIK